MKKTLSLLLVALMAMSVVFAGGESENKGDDGAVTLRLQLEKQAVEPESEGSIVKAIYDRLGIHVTAWELDPAKWDEQINVRFAGGDLPDVFVTDTTGLLPDYVNGGIVGEVSQDYIREKAPHYAAAIDMYAPEAWNTCVYKGKNYGIAHPMATYPFAVYWNKNWLDAVGREAPTTLEEMEDVLLAFVNEDPDGNGKKDTAGMAERGFNAVFGAYGLRIVTGAKTGFKVEEMQMDEDGLPFFPYVRPEAKEALALLHRWYTMGIIDKEFITGEHTGGYNWLSQSFMNGKIGMTTAQVSHYFNTSMDFYEPGNMGQCMREFKKLDPNARVIIGPAPIGPEGKSGTEEWAPIGRITFFTSEITKDQRKLDAYLSLLEELYADPSFALLLEYGEEGIDYESTPYGLSRLTDVLTLRKKGGIQFGNGNTVPFAMENRKAQHDFATSVTGNGYPRISVPAVPEYSSVIATLDTLAEQAYFDIITGAKPVDYFDTFVQQWNAAGGKAAEDAVREAVLALR